MARESERRRSRPLQNVGRKKRRPRDFSRGFSRLRCRSYLGLRRVVPFFGGAAVWTPGIVGSLKVNMYGSFV